MSKSSIVSYVRSSFEELTKVVWPTKSQAIRISIIVLVVTSALTLFLAGLDILFNLGLTELIKQIKVQ
ncbi:MAG: preprotein translocase subunit SecE [Candidatus Gracilibacteria bacterium]|jgi:preprotein translocase subunit SecE|nr:preprotein translocase subunit SecE [Candidatus Gracilibacteria bacterium]